MCPRSMSLATSNQFAGAEALAAHHCCDGEDRRERGVGYVEHKRRDRQEPGRVRPERPDRRDLTREARGNPHKWHQSHDVWRERHSRQVSEVRHPDDRRRDHDQQRSARGRLHDRFSSAHRLLASTSRRSGDRGLVQ